MSSFRRCVIFSSKNIRLFQKSSRTISGLPCLMQKIELKNISKVVQSKQINEHLRKSSVVEVNLRKSKGITVQHSLNESANSALIRHCLEMEPNKDGMIKAVDMYIRKNKTRRGHVDFISTAVKFIEPYGLEKDIDVYNKVLDVFPRDKFNNKSLFDAVWPKAHPQMFLALDILTKMEWQGVIPTEETHDILIGIFGPSSLPVQKVYRFWFWFDLFKDLNPYRLPDETYNDRVDVIKAAIDRISENKDNTKIIEISEPIEVNGKTDYNHFIISSQTTIQQKYLSLCCVSKPLYVEGPIHIWMNHKKEEYFIMKTGKGDLLSTEGLRVEPDEEREGVIVGVCFATKPYEENLQRWIKFLQEENPTLKEHKIIFDIIDRTDTEGLLPALASN